MAFSTLFYTVTGCLDPFRELTMHVLHPTPLDDVRKLFAH